MEMEIIKLFRNKIRSHVLRAIFEPLAAEVEVHNKGTDRFFVRLAEKAERLEGDSCSVDSLDIVILKEIADILEDMGPMTAEGTPAFYFDRMHVEVMVLEALESCDDTMRDVVQATRIAKMVGDFAAVTARLMEEEGWPV